jgi:DNA-binding NarL/FixJ family response regulator
MPGGNPEPPPASGQHDAPPASPARLRVLIVDADPLARRAIRDALQAGGVAVVAEAGDGAEAVGLALHYRPDVVLMDLLTPGGDGIGAIARIRDESVGIHVVMLSTIDDPQLALTSLRAGAGGYLVKDLELARLAAILEGVVAGEAALDARLAGALIEELRRPRGAGVGSRPVSSDLTGRQWEVLDLLDAGLSVEAIADRLVVSGETVRSHIKSLYRRLGIHSRADLAAATRVLRAPASPAERADADVAASVRGQMSPTARD